MIWSSALTAAAEKAEQLWHALPKGAVLKLGEQVKCLTRKGGLLFTKARLVTVEIPFDIPYDGGADFVLNMSNTRSVYLFSWWFFLFVCLSVVCWFFFFFLEQRKMARGKPDFCLSRALSFVIQAVPSACMERIVVQENHVQQNFTDDAVRLRCI